MKTKILFQRILFTFLFSSISILVNAQDYVGFKSGFTIAHTEFNFGLGNNDKLGKGAARPTLLIFTELKAGKYYSFTPDISYTQTGNIIRTNDTIYTSHYNRVSYLGIGMINKVNILNGGFEVYGLAGPQFKYALGGRIARTGSIAVEQIVEKIDFEETNLRRFDMNVRTGIGLSKVSPTYKIILEWTYDIAFFDVNTSDLSVERNHKSTGVLLGLAFNLNKETEN